MPSTDAARNARKHAAKKQRRDALMLATLPTLDEWAFTQDGNDPDCSLTGRVYNHARYPDGQVVVTTPLRRLDHLTAITMSGTKYRLGTPSQDYLDYREKHGLGPISCKVFYFNPECDSELTAHDKSFLSLLSAFAAHEKFMNRAMQE